MKNKINNFSTIFIMMFPLFVGAGFKSLFNITTYDIWIVWLLGTFLGSCISFIYKKSNITCNNIVNVIGNGLLLLLGLIFITKLISSLYLSNTPNIVLLIPFSLLLFYSSDNIDVLKKSNNILMIVFSFLIILSLSSLMFNINYDYFFPVLNTSMKDIINGSILYALISTTPFLVIDDYKNTYSLKYYLFGSFIILLIMIVIVGNLGNDLASIYRYPEYLVLKNINLLGIIENVENILFMLWIIPIFNLCSLCSYNIKKNTSKSCYVGFIIISIFLLSYIVLNNHIYLEFILSKYVWILLLIIGVCLIK